MNSTVSASPVRVPHAARTLLARYAAIFRAAWAARSELAGPRRFADERAFLPAALALQDTPPHPAPRRAALALCAFFALAMAWSFWGEIDIVAVAQGRIVVSERTKLIQPLDAGVVRRIAVKDGDSVHAGQLLIELDATAAQADGASVAERLKAAEAEWRRTTALLHFLGIEQRALPTSSIDAQGRAERDDVAAKLARFDAEYTRRQAEGTTAREAVGKLEATVPLARQRESDVQVLASQGFVNQHAGQDRTRERIELERDLAVQRARASEAQAAVAEAQHNKVAYLAETARALRERQTRARLEREQLAQERQKTDQRSRLLQLTAPVAGTVQQLAVHTAGGVVTTAQVLMVIVPANAPVTAEVVLENKDIGFVREGQAAEIKLETFPFTRYGTVRATVKSLSADAVADEKRGAVFPVTLALERRTLDVDGKAIGLTPGMNVAAEIKTGRRRVLDYLLSPVRQATGESLKER